MRYRNFIIGIAGLALAVFGFIAQDNALALTNSQRAIFGSGKLSFVTNLKASNTTNFRTAYRANTGNVPIAFQGNSTTRGVDEGAVPYGSQYNSYDVAYQLANALNTAGIPAGAENWFGLSGANFNDYFNVPGHGTRDGRWATSGGTIFGTEKLQGGTAMQFPGVASGATYTTVGSVDKAVIYWQDLGAANRIMTYSVDGGATTNLTTSGVTAMRATSPISLGAKGVHSIAFNWVSGGTTLFFGIDTYDSSRNQISIWQQGISGGTSANMIDDGGAPGGGRITQLTLFPPKLIFTEMGIVNDWRTNVAVATSQANCTSFINSMKAINIDVILVIPPWDNATGTGNTANQAQYVAAMYAAAAAADVPVVDIRKRWTSYAAAVAAGWQRGTDNVHPSTAGYNDEAYNIFLPVIQSILSLKGSFLLDRDLNPAANDNSPAWLEKAA